MAQADVAEAEERAYYVGPTSPYEAWKAAQGVPTYRGMSIDLNNIELTSWPARGGSGLFINLDGTEGFNDTYVCEIPPGRSLTPIKHIYDEVVYVLKGQGTTTVWLDEKQKRTFEWHANSYFAIPTNAWHQFHNLSGSEPARYVAMTAAPRVINTHKDLDFVFNNPYAFGKRFDGEDDYFKEAIRPHNSHAWRTNFVADVLASAEWAGSAGGREGRGPGARSISYRMVNGSFAVGHSDSWPVGVYKKAHRHGPGIHVLLLAGTGYTLLWLPGQPIQRVDWRPGVMLVPPEMWFHQHFNAGPDPVLFLAIGQGSEKPKNGGGRYIYSSMAEDGDQISYEEEDPSIHELFEAELRKSGVECQMDIVHRATHNDVGRPYWGVLQG